MAGRTTKLKNMVYSPETGWAFYLSVPVDVRKEYGRASIHRALYTHDETKAEIIREYLYRVYTDDIRSIRSKHGNVRSARMYQQPRFTVDIDASLLSVLELYVDEVDTKDVVDVIRHNVKLFVAFTADRKGISLPAVKISDVTNDTVEDFVLNCPHEVTGEERRAGGKAKLLEHLRAFFSLLMDEFQTPIVANFSSVRVPRTGRVRRVQWTEEEFQKLLRRNTNDKLHLSMILIRYDKLTPKDLIDLDHTYQPKSPQAKEAFSKFMGKREGLVFHDINPRSLSSMFSLFKTTLGYGYEKSFIGLAFDDDG